MPVLNRLRHYMAEYPDILNFTMPNGGDITLTRVGSPTAVTLEYSTDNGATWTTWAEDGNGNRTLPLQAGVTMFIRNTQTISTGFSRGIHNCYQFSFTDKVDAGGNVNSLLCKYPQSATLSGYCYYHLFRNCTTLLTAPDLPSTALKSYCYYNMFIGCTSLTTAPDLPATTLQTGCYGYMFANCTSLTTAPDLPASALKIYCYFGMFIGCSNLTSVTTHMTDISATDCLHIWLSNVAASGTLYCPAATAALLPSGDSGIPSEWTQVDI